VTGKSLVAVNPAVVYATRRTIATGAFGLGTALIYPPGSFAGTDELLEMARVVGAAGGVYATHLRSEGDRLL